MVVFAVLLGGIYSAYRQFSGLDPLKIDPQALVLNFIKSKSPKEFIAVLESLQLNRFLDGKLKQSTEILGQESNNRQSSASDNVPIKSQPSFSFVLVADSHNENNYLNKALTQAKAKKENLQFIIGLGDYTDTGTIEELKKVKQVFDEIGLRYFLTPGDHDLWHARDQSFPPDEFFIDIFGLTYQSFTYENFRFIILNNSDNYLGVNESQLDWLELRLQQAKKEGNKAIYVFMHEPLYHPSSDHVMGGVNQDLKKAAKNLIRTFKDAGVRQVFFGHAHFFSKYTEPESNLVMTAIGALTPKNNAQAPRYAIVTVFKDGSLEVEDTEVK